MHFDSPTGRRQRILVVDDDANAREALTILLTDAGFDVRGAHDGVSAFAQLATFRPDVIITDVRMPRMDGLALVDAVNALPGIPPRFIFMSGSARPDEPAGEFVHKPIVFDELLALL